MVGYRRTIADRISAHSLPRARVAGAWYPLDTVSHHALARWHGTHHALTAGHRKALQGGDVHQLWVTTAPGRPRGNRPAPPAGLPAARRTLEAAHRRLVTPSPSAPRSSWSSSAPPRAESRTE
ncbi:hypothetical protein ACFW6F_32995 [Streptomyces sp. NPDC058746]|uniref:hypothetical protein n=1 Tax=Streptomyces sp. NPDC058746 TaxID=3346622 RepID=UPI0036C3297A